MRIIYTGVGRYLPLSGGTLTGDLTIGDNKLKMTTTSLYEFSANKVAIRNLAGTAYLNLVLSALYSQSDIIWEVDAKGLRTKAANNAYVPIYARDNNSDYVEIARFVSAADPYLQATLPMVLKPAAIPGTLVEGHFAYVADDDKLAFYDGANAQFLGSNLVGAFTTFRFTTTTSIGADVTKYLSPGSADSSDTETVGLQIVVPVAGTLKNLYIKASTAPGADKTFIYTVRVNGADTELTATISGAETTASDITHSAAVAVGDLVSVKVVTLAGAASHAPAVSLVLS